MPLDLTLFGWPKVAPATPLEELGLLIGVPLIVIVLVFAVAKGHAVLMTSKHGPGPHASDPVWMGGRARSIMGGAEDELPELETGPRRELGSTASTGSSTMTSSTATSSTSTSTSTGASTATTSEAGSGGASARW